jgi:dipeptidyl aminopeptidase/acylaminoacyl peptidase
VLVLQVNEEANDVPLWSVPVLAGGARKLGFEASAASWSPDGQRLAFVRYGPPSRLAVARGDGSDPSLLFESPDPLTWVRWSPDGQRLRFGLRETETTHDWILEIPAAGGTPRRLFQGLEGDWSADGRAFYFAVGGAGGGAAAGANPERRANLFVAVEPPRWQIWAKPRVQQLTYGPLQMALPVRVPGSRSLLARGCDHRGQLMRYDVKVGRFEPLLGGLSGGFLDYSWDGRWAAWVDAHDLTLWRSRADGTEPLQLTTPPLAVGLVRWSPDGTQLAFVGRPPDSLPRIYVLPSDGGTPEPVSPPEKGQVWDPGWMPDGKTVVWGRVDGGGIRAFDLETRKLSVLPQTDDLWFPKCSRQGLILASRSVGSQLKTTTYWTYDPRTGRREDLGVRDTLAYPNFTRDGQSVVGLAQGLTDTPPGIYRFALRERRVEKVADLGTIQPTSTQLTAWTGLDPDDAPVLLSDTGSHELYVLDLEWP